SGTSALAGDAGLQALRPEPGRLSGPRLPTALASPNGAPVQPARRPGCHPTVTRKCLLLNHAEILVRTSGTLEESPRGQALPSLTALSLNVAVAADRVVYGLAESALAPRLRHLCLSGCELGADAFAALWRASLRGLTSLDLSGNALGPAGAEA